MAGASFRNKGSRVSKRGFTLIELLVVIAIIAILAAILFPVFANAKERARQTTCLNNLKQLGQSFRSYCDDYDGTMPSGSTYVDRFDGIANPVDWCGSPDCGRPVVVSDGQLWSYTKNRDIYLCPTDKNIKKGAAVPGLGISYSMNYALHRKKLDSSTAGRTSKVLLLIHEGIENINDGYFGWSNDYDIQSKIHYDGTTVIYCDLHAKWQSFNELERQRNDKQWMVAGQ